MTWNIRHGLGNDGCVDLDRIATVIAAAGADVVALQEVDRGWARSGGVEQAAALAEALGMSCAFGPNLLLPDQGHGMPASYGTAILSALPLAGSRNVPLPSRLSTERRGLLAATVTHPVAGTVRVACTHLHWGVETTPGDAIAERRDQVEAILAALPRDGTPTLLMGDFNAVPESEELAAMRQPGSGFVDAWRVVQGDAPGFTIPTDAPARRIDYLFVSAGVEIRAADVIDTSRTRVASDHFPVAADLTAVSPGP
jgi:endonuclease/exonuclease/phosphatase family metal-dependent hydrolase